MNTIVINSIGRSVVDFAHNEGHHCVAARPPGADVQAFKCIVWISSPVYWKFVPVKLIGHFCVVRIDVHINQVSCFEQAFTGTEVGLYLLKKKSLELASRGKWRCNTRKGNGSSNRYCRLTVTKGARTNPRQVRRFHTYVRNKRQRSLHNTTRNPFSIE